MLADDIARIPRLTPDELHLEISLADLAIAGGAASPQDVTYRAALEKRLTAQPEPAVSSDPELIARIQAEQRYMERVRTEQEAAGLIVPLSGFPGLSEWRSRVLQACVCAAVSVDCPVHATLL